MQRFAIELESWISLFLLFVNYATDEFICPRFVRGRDCIFVALAEREECEMITADQRLITSLPGFPIIHLDSI